MFVVGIFCECGSAIDVMENLICNGDAETKFSVNSCDEPEMRSTRFSDEKRRGRVMPGFQRYVSVHPFK